MFNNDMHWDVKVKSLAFLDPQSLARFASCSTTTNTLKREVAARESADFAKTRFTGIVQYFQHQRLEPTFTPLPERGCTHLLAHQKWILVKSEEAWPRELYVYDHTQTPTRRVGYIEYGVVADVRDGHILYMDRQQEDIASIIDIHLVNLDTGTRQTLRQAYAYLDEDWTATTKIISENQVVTRDAEDQISVLKFDGTLVARRQDTGAQYFKHWTNTIFTLEGIPGAWNVVAWNLNRPAETSVICTYTQQATIIIHNNILATAADPAAVSIYDLNTMTLQHVIAESAIRTLFPEYRPDAWFAPFADAPSSLKAFSLQGFGVHEAKYPESMPPVTCTHKVKCTARRAIRKLQRNTRRALRDLQRNSKAAAIATVALAVILARHYSLTFQK